MREGAHVSIFISGGGYAPREKLCMGGADRFTQIAAYLSKKMKNMHFNRERETK